MKLPKMCVKGCAIAAISLFAMSVNAETVDGTPDAYIEYITATGTQYVSTGVLPSLGLKARIDMKWTALYSVSNGKTNYFDWSFLDAKGGGDTRFYMLHLNCDSAKTKPAITYGYGKFCRTSVIPSSGRHEIVSDFTDGNAIQIYQNGSKCINATDQQNLTTNVFTMPNLPLYLFGCNNQGSINWRSNCRLYGLKMFKKNDETGKLDLIRNYLPCKKDGRAALYEKVEGKIYFSDSGDDFWAGPELPRPAEMVEWVQSNKKEYQYLDTLVYGKSGLRSEVDFIHMDDNQVSGQTDIDRCVLGARKTNSGSEANSRFYLAYFFQGAFCYGYRSLYYKGGSNVNLVSAVNGTRYVVKSELSTTNQSVIVNGTEIHKDGIATDGTYFTTDNTLTLFAMHEGASDHKVYSTVRLFYAKIWDGDELLRDFAPCVDSNGKAGLYDGVTERIFYLAGNKEFNLTNNVGAVTNWLSETVGTIPDAKIGYIESDGTEDYFDLDVIGKDGVKMETVMEWVTVPSDGAFVGSRNEAGPVRFFPYHYWPNGGGYHRMGYGTDLWDIGLNSTAAVAGQRFKIETILDEGAQTASLWVMTEGGAWNTVTSNLTRSREGAASVNTGVPLYLFAINNDGEAKYFGRSRVYKLRLSEKQQDGSYKLVRDLVPCKYNGMAMLYDNVSGRFFRNKGRYLAIGGGRERPWSTGSVIYIK